MIESNIRRRLLACVSSVAMIVGPVQAGWAHGPQAPLAPNDLSTTTPIKHVILIIGENRSFDHVFGTYMPKGDEKVDNLLSRGIVNADGTPGPHFAKAQQMMAKTTGAYAINPQITGPYKTLPPPLTGGAPQSASDETPPPFQTVSAAEAADYGLTPRGVKLLTTGATGLPPGSVDTRIANVTSLPDGPFRLTPSLPYDGYAASPVHRFYQMWQQTDCATAHVTTTNPSGCLNDLFPWVEVTVGAGSNGKPQPSGFNDASTGEGSTSMGFYSMATGDVPYIRKLAEDYAISDNYHQGVMGGTGANHIMIGSADAMWYSDGKGNPTTPPSSQIENPNPQANTNNYYTQDGYSGGSYTDCADTSQPGVAPIASYLGGMKIKLNCDTGHYYLLNNYNPGYFGNGTVDTTDTYAIPPSSVRTIGDDLTANQISWRYYGEGWNQYALDPHNPSNVYCNICNPFQYTTSVMASETARDEHLKDTTDFYNDVQDGVLPAVSVVKPGGLNDGHPSSSKFDIFESFVHKILDELHKKPELEANTVVLITVDEGGGYYDSGYIQPVDFFGDGTRIPLIAVSPWSRGGHVSHVYADHASFAKFVEKNWNLPPITGRSRDNLPNPIQTGAAPYAPTNGPAIGDLMDMFDF